MAIYDEYDKFLKYLDSKRIYGGTLNIVSDSLTVLSWIIGLFKIRTEHINKVIQDIHKQADMLYRI